MSKRKVALYARDINVNQEIYQRCSALNQRERSMSEDSESKLIAFIDGACEPINPGGTASYGVVVKIDGVTVFADSAIVGSGLEMSNNVAEYSGLLAFLEWYIQHADSGKATVHSDSSLLINQMTGYWCARRGLYLPYYERAWEIIRQNNLRDKIGYRWTPRERNQEADKLSKNILLTKTSNEGGINGEANTGTKTVV